MHIPPVECTVWLGWGCGPDACCPCRHPGVLRWSIRLQCCCLPFVPESAPVQVLHVYTGSAEHCLAGVVSAYDVLACRFFYLVQMLKQPAQAAGEVRVRWLQHLADGLYHPSTKEWDESASALSKVRTQKILAKKDNRLCYKLLTLRSKIEAVELEN